MRRNSPGTSIGHGVYNVSHVSMAAGDVAKVSTQIVARIALRTAGVAKAIGGVAAAMDAILIPIDVVFLVKAAIDVHKYNGGKGRSNSTAANRIGEIIAKLEEHGEQMRSINKLLIRQ